MKEYEIEIRHWINGSGWEYNSTIDCVMLANDVDVQKYVDTYASDYVDDMHRNDFVDGDYVIVAIAPDGERTESEWLSSFLDEDDED